MLVSSRPARAAHLVAAIAAPPAVSALVAGFFLCHDIACLHRAGDVAGMAFALGSMTGYVVETVFFLPLVFLLQRRGAVFGWTLIGAGAVAGAAGPLLLCPPSADPEAAALLSLFAAFGAAGGLAYWLALRARAATPFSGLSGSQP
jgi:hypothetical protein